MKPLYFSLAVSSATLIACSPLVPTHQASSGTGQTSLSQVEKLKIGNKVWQNECAGTLSGLTSWNKGEEFPSMGIGHFIWYPKNFDGRWTESFPEFIAFAKAAGHHDIPVWVLSSADCPWNTRNAFIADINGQKLTSLRQFLARSVSTQTDFILQKSQAALSEILRTAPLDHRQKIANNYKLVSSTSNGTYALIDYVNFKGEGTNPRERYKQQGWGLLQVLTNMRDSSGGQDSARAFADSAKKILDRRISNSPAARGEARWRAGWHKRCESYARAL